MSGETLSHQKRQRPSADPKPELRLVVAEVNPESATATREDFRTIAGRTQKPGSFVYGGAWMTLVRRFDFEIHHEADLMLPERKAWYQQNYGDKPFPVKFRQHPEPNPNGCWSEPELRTVDLLVLDSLQTFVTMIDRYIEAYGDDVSTALLASTGAMKVGPSKLDLWRQVIASPSPD
jgi:hypothetical protein